jgi:hypothetical protein
MNEEAIKALYESVSADYEVGTLDEFKAYLSDDTKRGKFFEDVIKPEYDVESIDEFETTYGLKKKADSTLETEDMVGTTEMGTTPGSLDSSETPPVSIPVQEETLLIDGFDPSTLTAPLEDGSIPDPLDTEAKVLTELEIEPVEFKSWKEKNLRPESKSYKFFKELLLNDEGEQYEDEQKIQKQVTAYLAQKLNKNLEAIEAADEEAKKVLIEQNRKDAQTIVNNLKAYKKEAVIDDLESRKKLLRRQRAGGVKMAASTGFEMIKAAGNAAANFAMGTAAALFTEADALLNATGADKKGALLGIAEMFLDSAEHYSLDAGETQRSTFVQGKEVISNGKTYIVSDDGVVYDEETHIRVDDILPETEVASIQDKASKIEGDSTSFDMGSGLTGLTSTVVNLFGLITGAKKLQKILGVNPKVGMGLMSFSSTVASSVESVKDDLMAQGVSEKEATNKALVFGSAIATLDGVFSALAGSNEKLLGSTKVVKDLLIDLAKKKGKDFSAQQLKRKAGDLIKENAKELFIEEIPVLLSERGINNVINYSVGMDVRAGVEDLKRADFMETAFLTLGATTGMGSKRLLTSNQRNDVVRYLSNNIKDVDVVSAKLVTEGLLTQQEADNAVSEVKSMQYAETKVSGAVKTTENMIEAAALIEKKEKLISERENTDPSLRADIDKRINSIDQQLDQLKQKDDKDVQDIINGEKDGEIKIEVTREEAVEALKAENEANERLGLPTIIESEANILKTQEKLIKEKQDAIQKQETREVPDAKPAEGVQEVETEVRVTPEQETEVNPNQKYEDALADIDQQISDLRTEDGSILPKDMKKFKALYAKRVKAKFDAERGDSDGSMPIRVEGAYGGVLVGEEAIQAENDIENYIATIEKNVISGKITKEEGRDMIMRYVGAQGKYNFLLNEIDSMNRYVRDRLDSSIPEVGNNKSKFTDWRKGNKTETKTEVETTTKVEPLDLTKPTKKLKESFDNDTISKEDLEAMTLYALNKKQNKKKLTPFEKRLLKDTSLERTEQIADLQIKLEDNIEALRKEELDLRTEAARERIKDESEQTVSEIDEVTVTEEKVVPAGKRLFNNPNPETTEISKKYKKERNNKTPEGEPITSIDTENSREIADVYESLEDSPNDPKVQEAYSLMADETAAQHQEIINAGYEVEIWNGEGEPYANAQEMIDDVRENKHMWIFSTEAGFGDTAITEEQRQQNKLLQDSGFKDKNGNTLLYNDLFRFVHDFFGHTERGNGFGPVGEENAWDVHSRMYTPLARRAMTTETRGQNSWVNFGPQMRNDKGELIKKGEEGYLSPRERAFAPQKMALMPDLYSMLENEVEAGVSKLSQEFKGKPSMEEVYNKAEDLGITQKEAREYLNKIGYTEQEIKDFVFKREDMSVKRDVAGEKNIFVKGKNITLNFLDTIKRKLASAKSYMPKNAFIAKETKNAHIQAEVKVAERMARRLNKMLKGQPDSVYNEVNKLMRGEEADLPIKISLIATAMRNHIDSLSEKLVMSGAVESEAAAANIMSNIGEYMNRSYRLFDDKNYADNISEEVILEAKEFLKAQELNRITKEAAKENITPQEYVNKQEGGKNFTVEQYVDAKADQSVRRIIKKDEANAFVSAVVNEAKKDTKILKERKEIPAEIRALMGEYTDAAYNYVMSVGKIKAIIETQKYLDKLKDIGDGVFLFKEGDPRIPDGYTKIASETNKSLEPLNGYYAPKELVDQMNSGAINVEGLGKFWQGAFENYMKAVGAVKYTKTILSVGTHVKNVLGNVYFMAQNGYFNPKDYNEAYKVLKNEFKNLDNEQLNKKLDEYIKAGIINQGVSLREVQGLLEGEQDFDVKIEKRTAKRSENVIKKGAKYLGRSLEDAYQAEDDLFKIVAYENEKRDYAKIEYDKDYNDLTEKEKAKVDSKVAEIVKNILPNYSRLGNISKLLRAAPVATFISFQLEAYRTAYNSLDLALKEVKSKNPRERKKGAKRLTTLIGFQGIKYAVLGMLGNALLGDDDEDEEESKVQEVLEGAIGISKPKTGVMDARPFLPFWSQNSDILITKAGDGKFSYIDMSASDPYGGLAKVVRAFQRGDNVKDAVLDAATELLNPIFSPDILAGGLNTIMQNRDVYGKKVFEETDSADESAIKIIDVLYKTFEPGTLTSLRKIAGMDTPGKAYTDYGRYVTKMMNTKTGLLDVIGQLTGFKKNDVDIEMQMNYKLGDLKEQMKPIEIKQYIAKKNIETTGDAREYVKLIKSEHADKDEIYQEASKLVKSAMKFGLTIEKIYPMLKSKFPKADDAAIIFLYDQIASELMPKDE